MPAPNMNASSLRRLTGMLISSAASESSRSGVPGTACARADREVQHRDHEGDGDESEVEVALGESIWNPKMRERVESRRSRSGRQ